MTLLRVIPAVLFVLAILDEGLAFWCLRDGLLDEARQWRTAGLFTGAAAVLLGLST